MTYKLRSDDVCKWHSNVYLPEMSAPYYPNLVLCVFFFILIIYILFTRQHFENIHSAARIR